MGVECWLVISSPDFCSAFFAFQKVNAASQSIMFHVLTFVLFVPLGCEYFFKLIIFVF